MNFDYPDGPPDPVFDPTRRIIPTEPRKPSDAITDPFDSEPATPGKPFPIDTTDLWRDDPRWYMKILTRVRDAAIEKATDPALLRRVIGMLTEWLLTKLATKVLK